MLSVHNVWSEIVEWAGERRLFSIVTTGLKKGQLMVHMTLLIRLAA